MEYDVSLHIKKLEKGEQIKPKVEKWEWQLMKQKTDKQKVSKIFFPFFNRFFVFPSKD